jgi:UDP-glucose:glycoprotein glucosyltransferase
MQRHSKPWRVATAVLVVATAVAASTIDVRINAAWNQTPILAEASEAVAAFSPEAFWAFVDMTAPIAPSLRRQLEAEGETPPEPTATSPQIDQYARALSLLPALIFNEAQQKLARSELAARAFSPKVAAHHDLALQALKTSPDGEKCKDDAFFDFGAGRLICDAKRFDEAVQSGTTQCHAPEEVTLEGEHTLKPPASAAAAPGPCNAAAVLYGVLGTERTLQFVKLARTAAQKGTCTVTFRHYIANTSNLDYPLGVQGYGITIDVKNMEYKAVDEKKAVEENADSDAEVTLPPVEGMDVNLLAKRFPQLRANLTAFAQRATSSVNADLDLKVWEVQKLGIQAAHHVLADSNPMQSLTDLTENFPARVSIISRIPHDDALAQTSAAVTQLANYYGDGENRLWINKRHVDSNEHDLFSLLATLRKEETQYNKLLSVLTGKSRPVADHNDAVTSMTRCPLNSPVGGEKPRLWINESLPYWINNIETDDMYSMLPLHIGNIVRPGPYGQPKFARRNLLNMIYVIDPTERTHLEAMQGFMRPWQQGAAVRFGFLLSFPELPKEFEESFTENADGTNAAASNVGVLIATAFRAMQDMSDPAAPVMFLLRVLWNLAESPMVTEGAVRAAAAALGVTTIEPTMSTAAYMKNATRQVKQLGISTLPMAVFNGKVDTESPDEALFRNFNTEFMKLREMVTANKLVDSAPNMYDAVHAAFGAVKRYQPAVFDNADFREWLSTEHWDLLAQLSWLFSLDYNYEVCSVSHVLAVNVSSAAGLRDLKTVLDYFVNCPAGQCTKSRLALLPTDSSRAAAVLLSVTEKAKSLPERKRLAFVRQFVIMFAERFAVDETLADAALVNSATYAVLRELGSAYQGVLEWSPDFVMLQHNRGAKLVAPADVAFDGVTLLHTNGRVTKLDESFVGDDFAVLEKQERENRNVADCVSALDFATLTEGKVSGDDLSSEFYSNKAFMLTSVLTAGMVTQGARTHDNMLPNENTHHAFKAGVHPAWARHSVIAVLNPVSQPAQKLVGLLNFMIRNLNVSVRVHLNPPRELQKVPLKNYYRFVATSELQFVDSAIATPKALVRGLPTNVVLTLGIDDPNSWMVFAAEAESDLDNLKLSTASHVEKVVYELKNIIVTGSCTDINRMSPPRGLPIDITDADGTRDTLVMSNFGYFQLQSRPGVGTLHIQPGRGSDIFEFDSMNGAKSSKVAITSFGGSSVELHVHRRPGQEQAELLAESADKEEGAETGGKWWNPLGARKVEKWPSKVGDQPQKPDKPTLNIFSLASGHLYERFLRLMMHTVMKTSSDVHGKNTTRIKFWLIENPMSPRFKRLLPKLAEKYGFEYSLVKYKWPHWLTRQTEKQRMIWAYKVLFLDVLFPIEVEKIIFVDADQIVRSDLHELYHFDLEGKPVAYTPFCRESAREETKGFRFWDSGYWKEHLGGRPYHISAIYVVDLMRLRQLGAGDRYRIVYDGLARDPNSLANLDQDLPNYAQHQVPIQSLPEEWLWCETWCSDASKAKAKTIDLCNNPLTKAPKLENAKRIIPDWEDMDNELQAFEDSVFAKEDQEATQQRAHP